MAKQSDNGFINVKKSFKGYTVEEVTVFIDGVEKPFKALVNANGAICTREEFDMVVDTLQSFYAIPDLEIE